MATKEEITKKIDIKNKLVILLPRQIAALQKDQQSSEITKKIDIKNKLVILLPRQIAALQKNLSDLMASQAAKPSTPKQPEPSAASTGALTVTAAPTAKPESAKAEQIKATHLQLLQQCGFITTKI